MILENTKNELLSILRVINDAASKFKGVIPDDCWHEPYMLEKDLISEFDNNVHMFGYEQNGLLVGVMGIQEVEDVTLIRHAYTLPEYQGLGIGTSILRHLLNINTHRTLLVGTWQDATWAIRFYVNNGFVLHGREQTEQLLKRYWNIPLKQVENSVVLERHD
jgi:GNAT superfamily N-acetyltransferase